MAQIGDTITYTFSDGSVVTEDISNTNLMEVDFLNGPGGGADGAKGGNGGSVEGTLVDVSSFSILYIWVGEAGENGRSGAGRYNGGEFGESLPTSGGGGSTEIAFVNTNASDSADEPFIVAAGGGGGGGVQQSGPEPR